MRTRPALIGLMLVTAACGRPSPEPEASRQDERREAEALLRRALAARPAGIYYEAGTCVYLRLEPPEPPPAASARVAPLTRIDPVWLPRGASVTEQRYGCANTVTYSAPVFDRATLDGVAYQTAVIEIAHLCGPVCGETGALTFYRRAGRRDWEEPVFTAGAFL